MTARVPTGCKPLDDLLGGGFERGTITELFGEGGSGKSNIVLVLAAGVARAGKKAIIIDTEGISLERLFQVCGGPKDREAAQSAVYGRADAATELAELGAADPAEEGRRATLGDLLKAFAAVMEEAARDRVHRLEPIGVTIEDKVRFIRGRLRREGRTSFRELFVAGEPRSHWIVTFVALLEMAREGEVRLRQGDRFGEIHVYAEELE